MKRVDMMGKVVLVTAQATPADDLRRQVLDPSIPKTEREHWAGREIMRLEEQAKVRNPMSDLERCACCDEPTGKAGRADDSIYCDVCDCGPFCDECWAEHLDGVRQEESDARRHRALYEEDMDR